MIFYDKKCNFFVKSLIVKIISVNIMKFLYYVASIGNNNIDIKLEILLFNLEYIYKNIKVNYDVIINCYDENDKYIYENIKKLKFVDKIYMYKKEGVLTELFLTNPNNMYIKNYDYILFILDDVKIKNLNILDLIKIKNKYELNIISPKILNATHDFMNQKGLTINNFLEIFCILVNPEDLNKFFNIHKIDNKWMWGVDFLFGFYNMKVGVYNKYVMEHKLKSKSHAEHHNVAHKDMDKYFRKYTPFKILKDVQNKYKSIIKYIDI